MPTPTEQLYSRTSYAGDGVTTAWNFTFAGGYLDKSHVKAYTLTPAGVRTELAVLPGDFLGEYQLSIVPAVPLGTQVTIYRDTPKDAPLVDFADGGNLTEAALDTATKQTIFAAAENADDMTIAIGPGIQAIAAQVNADATAAAESRDLAGGSATQATNAAIAAAGQAALAAAAASQAAGSASDAASSEAVVTTIAGAFTGTFGFGATAYDFGSISDSVTYLDLDLGGLP